MNFFKFIFIGSMIFLSTGNENQIKLNDNSFYTKSDPYDFPDQHSKA